MKRSLFICALLLVFSFAQAQKSNLIFFSEGGEPFYVVLNAVLQNATPTTNLKVSNLTAPSYKLKILFSDTSIASVEKTLYISQGTETTFNIKKKGAGDYVVRLFGEVPIAQSVTPTKDQTVMELSTSGPSKPVSTTTVSTTTTTTTSGVNTQPNQGVSMGVNMGGVNMNMNIGIPGDIDNMGATTSVTHTTTTTTTSTTGGISNNTTRPAPQQQQQQQPAPNYLPGYTGAIGCPRPISTQDFDAMKSSISAKTFEDSKLSVAKTAVAANCLFVSQVKEIMQLFTFEDSKLEFAKYAYSYTYDKGNYYKLTDVFTFDSTGEELNTYIQGK